MQERSLSEKINKVKTAIFRAIFKTE
jgi:hypothetical protein